MQSWGLNSPGLGKGICRMELSGPLGHTLRTRNHYIQTGYWNQPFVGGSINSSVRRQSGFPTFISCQRQDANVLPKRRQSHQGDKPCDVSTVPLVARWPAFLARGSDADGEPHRNTCTRTSTMAAWREMFQRSCSTILAWTLHDHYTTVGQQSHQTPKFIRKMFSYLPDFSVHFLKVQDGHMPCP